MNFNLQQLGFIPISYPTIQAVNRLTKIKYYPRETKGLQIQDPVHEKTTGFDLYYQCIIQWQWSHGHIAHVRLWQQLHLARLLNFHTTLPEVSLALKGPIQDAA